jgi:hypothetical protein
LKTLNKQSQATLQLENLRKLSETISVDDLDFLDVERVNFETLALETMNLKPEIKLSDLKRLQIKTPPSFLFDYEEFSKNFEIVNEFKKIKKTLNKIKFFINEELIESELMELRSFTTKTLGAENSVSFNEEERLSLENIVIELLRSINSKTVKIYFNFNNEKLTSIPETGNCLLVASITIGYKNGLFSSLLKMMSSGKTFKEAFLEKLKFQMGETYVRIYKMDKYSFKDYEKRKIPLVLVPNESIAQSLKSKNLETLSKILKGRPLSDKERILDIIASFIKK